VLFEKRRDIELASGIKAPVLARDLLAQQTVGADDPRSAASKRPRGHIVVQNEKMVAQVVVGVPVPARCHCVGIGLRGQLFVKHLIAHLLGALHLARGPREANLKTAQPAETRRLPVERFDPLPADWPLDRGNAGRWHRNPSFRDKAAHNGAQLAQFRHRATAFLTAKASDHRYALSDRRRAPRRAAVRFIRSLPCPQSLSPLIVHAGASFAMSLTPAPM